MTTQQKIYVIFWELLSQRRTTQQKEVLEVVTTQRFGSKHFDVMETFKIRYL